MHTKRKKRPKLNLINQGVAGDFLKEEVPKFIERTGDVVFNNQNNAWIVLGRDRPSNKASGYGGMNPPGGSGAGAIDLVAGRISNQSSGILFAENDFKRDAARIYISQKTDIDDNFSLANGTIGKSIMRSAVAVKADAVRIIGREGIKLVTGVADGEKNSQGNISVKIEGIDLIAGNFDTKTSLIPIPFLEGKYPQRVMQPLVKGYNLQYALTDLVDRIENLSGIVGSFLATQMEYNGVISMHTHASPFYGDPTFFSIPLATKNISISMRQLADCVLALSTLKVNLVSFKTNFLTDKSDYYINSRYNRTN